VPISSVALPSRPAPGSRDKGRGTGASDSRSLANLFPANPEQARISEAYIAQLNQTHAFDAPVATKVEPGRDFYPAEDYHQDFLTRNPQYPYIVINDLPKIENLKRLFPDLYRATPVLVSTAAPRS